MKADEVAGKSVSAESGLAAAALAAWTAGAATLMLWGYGLSAFGALASVPGWILGAVAAVMSALWAARSMAPQIFGAEFRAACVRTGRTVLRESPLLGALVAGVASVVVAAAITLLAAAPSNWDSHVYHLARVGYYLQQGSLDDYGANFYGQEEHARGVSIGQCAIMTLSGRSDRLVGLPQLLGYLMCLTSVYALARELGRGRAAALAAAAMFGLLTIAAMEAPTPQNDLVLASFIGAGLLGALGYVARGGRSALVLTAGGFAVALAVKATALTCVPAVGIAIAAAAWSATDSRRAAWRRAGTLTLAVIAAVLVLAGPAGYWKNFRRFGNPLGGTEMMQHHIALSDANGGRWHMGVRNLVRFAGDLCTLDGLPESWGGALGSSAKEQIGAAVQSAGVDAESPADTNALFSWSRPRYADENLSYFGWVGVALFLPGCLGALLGARREARAFAFAIAFGVFLAGQAFAGPYDPWRGRHFLYGAIFAAPAAAWLFESRARWLREWAWTVAIFASVAVVPAVLWRVPNPLLTHGAVRSVFQLDRLEQMAVLHPSYPALRAFDRLVPPGATVIVALPGNEYEYVLFGKNLSRRLIPYPRAQRQPDAARTAEFLLYDRRLQLVAEPADIDLGYFWSLRKLTPRRQ